MVVKGFNGVSYGVVYTITAADDAAGTVSFEFGYDGTNALPFPLAYSIQVITSAGVFVPLVDAVITPNAGGVNGVLTIADGAATFALTATDVIMILAQPARDDVV